MVLTEDEATRDLQVRITKVLRDLLKPVRVESLAITRADKYLVRGVLTTICPIEKIESGKDFEVGLAGNKEGSISYVSVDGRRLFPRRTKPRASKRGGRR
jgi:hypothetical protein